MVVKTPTSAGCSSEAMRGTMGSMKETETVLVACRDGFQITGREFLLGPRRRLAVDSAVGA